MAHGQIQQFASAPQAVGSRNKYRDPDETLNGNLMNDKRVIRGNTYAALVQPPQDMAEVQKQREAQRRRLHRANQTQKKRPGTPDAIPGRKHMDIQTDSYLEELTERTVEFEAETQTDFLLDRPPSPLFMPAKIGMDIDTQIEEGDLFDFDVECEPVLEVLVGKTLEQSMMEVLEEEELESLRRHQEEFEKRRNAELQEVQRMEAAEKRRSDELQRRIQQQESQRVQDLSAMRKVVSRAISTQHLLGLKDRVLMHLSDAGIFTDQTQLSVESTFLPELWQFVMDQMHQRSESQALVQDVLKSSVALRCEKHSQVLDVERRRLSAIDDAERKARVEKDQVAMQQRECAAALDRAQACMKEWEAYEPPKPEEDAAEWVQVLSINLEEKTAVLAGDAIVEIFDEKVQELLGQEDMFAQLQPGETVLAQVVSRGVLTGSPETDSTPVVVDFRINKPAEGGDVAPP